MSWESWESKDEATTDMVESKKSRRMEHDHTMKGSKKRRLECDRKVWGEDVGCDKTVPKTFMESRVEVGGNPK